MTGSDGSDRWSSWPLPSLRSRRYSSTVPSGIAALNREYVALTIGAHEQTRSSLRAQLCPPNANERAGREGGGGGGGEKNKPRTTTRATSREEVCTPRSFRVRSSRGTAARASPTPSATLRRTTPTRPTRSPHLGSHWPPERQRAHRDFPVGFRVGGRRSPRCVSLRWTPTEYSLSLYSAYLVGCSSKNHSSLLRTTTPDFQMIRRKMTAA